MRLKASAPGSLMLLGEYAVLYGKRALSCAVDKRITVTLTPRTDTRIEIESTTLGCLSTDVTDIKIEKPFQFVLCALQQYQTKLKRGCDISIETEFSDKVGLGSSAAVTVATLATLVTWLDIKTSPRDLVRQGRNVVRQIQGLGSGADIAASVYGGVVSYTADPLSVEKFSVLLPLHAVYAGFKTPTVDAINYVQSRFITYPELFRSICNSIGQCGVEGTQLLRKEDLVKLGEIMNVQQGMMESLGVNTPRLQNMVDHLRQQPGILGAKISGSGLGDCVIALGELPADYHCFSHDPAVQRIPFTMALQGVYCEKI